MFNSFRRKTQAEGQEQPNRPTTPPSGTNFFSLPAELRNDIYYLVAKQTSLYIHALERASGQRPPPVPGLMLTSRQSRHEFLPILLATASIRGTIRNFDFKPLDTIVRSLYNSRLRALRQNLRGLKIRLVLDRKERVKEDVVRWRVWKWCNGRVDSLDRLGWGHAVDAGSDLVALLTFTKIVRDVWGRASNEVYKQEVRGVLDVLDQAIDERERGKTGDATLVKETRMMRSC